MKETLQSWAHKPAVPYVFAGLLALASFGAVFYFVGQPQVDIDGEVGERMVMGDSEQSVVSETDVDLSVLGEEWSGVLGQCAGKLTGDLSFLEQYNDVRRPVVRLAQNTDRVSSQERYLTLDPEETERKVIEYAKHFDVMELYVAFSDWKYVLWGDLEEFGVEGGDATFKAEKKETALKMAAKLQEWIDIGHEYGLEMAFSFGWQGRGPVSNHDDVARLPDGWFAESFDPETGTFVQLGSFDWTKPRSLEMIEQGWREIAGLVDNASYLFFNEVSNFGYDENKQWYERPYFSESALADYREYLDDPDALFPATPESAPSARTDNTATEVDWVLWNDWLGNQYARRIEAMSRGAEDANTDNEYYKGAIWFQSGKWATEKFGIDVQQVAALNEVTYLVCETCNNVEGSRWVQFEDAVREEDNQMGSFVNMSVLDQECPDQRRVKQDAPTMAAQLASQLERGVEMVSLYSSVSVLPWSDSYNPEVVAAWDYLLPAAE